MRRPRILTPEEKEQNKILDDNRKKFKKLAKKRETRAKLNDIAFIEEYMKLCIKHKRLIGGMSPEGSFSHLKTSKATKKAFLYTQFRVYNRHEDFFPVVRSGWYLGTWRE